MLTRHILLATLVLSLTDAGCSRCTGGSADTDKGGTSTAPEWKGGGKQAILKTHDGRAAFAPSTNGFKFENYGNDNGAKNLTSAELRRMFGDDVCEDKGAGKCALTPPALEWMNESNKRMAGGHCEGLAALSLLMDLGKVSPNDFGGATTFDLKLDGNAKLQREIAYWFVTQFVPPMSSSEIRNLTPNRVVDTLAEALTKPGGETYTLGLYQPDGSEGHATTPYGVVDNGDGTASILHYDNNFPGEVRKIVVDRQANTWTYDTAADPKDPPQTYAGDAKSFSLTLSPTSVRMGKLECPFCGTVTAESEEGKGSVRGVREIFLDGDADLLITDDAGKRLGRVDGKMVEEIAGASFVQPRSGNAENEEPVYLVPVGRTLRVSINGTALKKPTATELSLIGPGYTLGIEGLMLRAGQKDTVQFSKDWGDVKYTTTQAESPTLSLGIDGDAADYLIEVKALGEAGGQTLEL